MWRKIEPKSTFVEKKWQIWGLVVICTYSRNCTCTTHENMFEEGLNLGLVYLNMMPTMQAWIITPTTDWSTKWSWKTIPKNKMLIWVEKLQEIHLKAHNKDCLRAFLRCHSSSITNCMLGLNTAILRMSLSQCGTMVARRTTWIGRQRQSCGCWQRRASSWFPPVCQEGGQVPSLHGRRWSPTYDGLN